MRLIKLLLAAPAIVAGIKTSALISVSTATIAASSRRRLRRTHRRRDCDQRQCHLARQRDTGCGVGDLHPRFLDCWLIPAGLRGR
jgi:hypothetical protein